MAPTLIPLLYVITQIYNRASLPHLNDMHYKLLPLMQWPKNIAIYQKWLP
jgi:hypothetical protein